MKQSREESGLLAIGAATIGNMLEWYDILVYAYLATTIATLFFPNEDPTVSTVLAFAAFGISFVARPLGAIVIGRYADVAGRKPALVLISSLMFIGTAMIVLTPTYAEIGVTASIILVCARVLQGFSAGGEFGSATSFLLERPTRYPCFLASWQFATQGLAMALSAAAGAALAYFFPPDEILDWAWRLPFVFGLLIGPVAIGIRHFVAEEKPQSTGALRELIAEKDSMIGGKSGLLNAGAIGIGLVVAATVSVYFLIYVPTFATEVLGMAVQDGYSTALVAGLCLLFGTPLAGFLGDHVGPSKVALVALTVLTVVPPLLVGTLAADPSPGNLILLQSALALVAAGYLGVLPALLGLAFPPAIRATGFNVAYNLAVMLAGGFAPMIFTILVAGPIGSTGPAYYLSAAAVISLSALFALVVRLRRRSQPSAAPAVAG